MNAQGFEIVSARFELLDGRLARDWKVRISAVARNIKHIALPFRAWVGTQRVDALTIKAKGDGFEGYLKEIPRAGDRLHVGYGPTILPTNIIYQQTGSGPAVA